MRLRRLCVFCGSSMGTRPAYRDAAGSLGILLARRGTGLVYGGGNIGLMGTVADACLDAGGEVIGVIPGFLEAKEVAHRGLSALHVVNTMHERKALMADLSDGFLCLPGGFGTFDEFCEILTWAQLRLQPKPVGMLNIEGYFDHLLAQFAHSVREGFLKPQHLSLLLAGSDPEALLGRMETAPLASTEKLASPDRR